MLTPKFKITQCHDSVNILIKAPYADFLGSEVYVDGTDFRFYARPYYLRLKLPGEIVEDQSVPAATAYDCEKAIFDLSYQKVTKGEYFENLDMITTLLAPPKRKKKESMLVPNIEVIGNPSAKTEDIDETLNEHDSTVDKNTDGNEWYMHQNNPTETISLSSNCPKYGFANKICGALGAFESAWIKEIIDLPMPDITPQSERKNLREKCELLDFSEEHYLADLMQPEYVKPYISFEAEWDTLEKNTVSFNDTEVDLLKELPNKEYLLSNEEIHRLLLGLVDILFGSCYNHRTTLGENTVESSWTIVELSSTLCWFEDFSDPKEVIKACFRRSLCYPLYRNWDLSVKVLEDVKKVIKLGKKYIIKRFCEIHSLFNNSIEPRYILNQLYIKDYLVWLQQIHETLIESLELQIIDIQPNKEEMGFDLVELEIAAYSITEDLIIENSVHDMVDQMDELTVNDNDKDKLSSSSSSSDSSDTVSETFSDRITWSDWVNSSISSISSSPTSSSTSNGSPFMF